MLRYSLALVLTAGSLSACMPVSVVPGLVPSRAATEAIGCQLPPDSAALKDGLLSAVNTRRRAAGLQPLRVSAALERAAAIVACDNAQRGQMTHVTRQGADLRARVRGQGYGYRMAAEALAHGYRSPEGLEAIWAGSSYHRPTLMTPSAQDAGISVVLSPGGSPWWAMISARSR